MDGPLSKPYAHARPEEDRCEACTAWHRDCEAEGTPPPSLHSASRFTHTAR
jgi:hypothetical protein